MTQQKFHSYFGCKMDIKNTMTLSGRTNVSIKKEKNLDKITLRKKYIDNLDSISNQPTLRQ